MGMWKKEDAQREEKRTERIEGDFIGIDSLNKKRNE
jgi:hypothetical protein